MASRQAEHLWWMSWPLRCAVHGLVVAVLTFFIAAFFALWVWKMLACEIKRPQIIPVLNLPLWYAEAPLALDRREQPADGCRYRSWLAASGAPRSIRRWGRRCGWWGSWRDRRWCCPPSSRAVAGAAALTGAALGKWRAPQTAHNRRDCSRPADQDRPSCGYQGALSRHGPASAEHQPRPHHIDAETSRARLATGLLAQP